MESRNTEFDYFSVGIRLESQHNERDGILSESDAIPNAAHWWHSGSDFGWIGITAVRNEQNGFVLLDFCRCFQTLCGLRAEAPSKSAAIWDDEPIAADFSTESRYEHCLWSTHNLSNVRGVEPWTGTLPKSGRSDLSIKSDSMTDQKLNGFTFEYWPWTQMLKQILLIANPQCFVKQKKTNEHKALDFWLQNEYRRTFRKWSQHFSI